MRFNLFAFVCLNFLNSISIWSSLSMSFYFTWIELDFISIDLMRFFSLCQTILQFCLNTECEMCGSGKTVTFTILDTEQSGSHTNDSDKQHSCIIKWIACNCHVTNCNSTIKRRYGKPERERVKKRGENVKIGNSIEMWAGWVAGWLYMTNGFYYFNNVQWIRMFELWKSVCL